MRRIIILTSIVLAGWCIVPAQQPTPDNGSDTQKAIESLVREKAALRSEH